MPGEPQGLWVGVRVRFVPPLEALAAGPSSAHPSPPTDFGRGGGLRGGIGGAASVTVRGATDVEGLEGEPDEDAALLVDRFVVTVDLTRLPPGIVPRDAVRDLRRAVGVALVESAGAVVSNVVGELEGSPSPSPPGAPPAQVTGRLLGSIRARPDEDGLGFAVGSDLAYAAYLEFGTTTMPARPFLFPALEQERRRIETNVRRAAVSAIAEATDRFRIEPLTTDRLGFPKPTGDPETDAVILWNFYYDRPPPVDVHVHKVKTVKERVGEWFDEHREEIREVLERSLDALEFLWRLRKGRGPRK